MKVAGLGLSLPPERLAGRQLERPHCPSMSTWLKGARFTSLSHPTPNSPSIVGWENMLPSPSSPSLPLCLFLFHLPLTLVSKATGPSGEGLKGSCPSPCGALIRLLLGIDICSVCLCTLSKLKVQENFPLLLSLQVQFLAHLGNSKRV